MNKELIFKLLDLNAIKVALKKYRIRVYYSDFDYWEVSLIDHNEGILYTICIGKEDNSCYIKYYTREHPMWSPKIDITSLEYEKVKLNLFIIRDYLNSLQDEEMTNLINEIINE